MNDEVGFFLGRCVLKKKTIRVYEMYRYIVLITCTLGDMYLLVVLKEILRRSLDVCVGGRVYLSQGYFLHVSYVLMF